MLVPLYSNKGVDIEFKKKVTLKESLFLNVEQIIEEQEISSVAESILYSNDE